MTTPTAAVFVIDDEAPVRKSLSRLLQASGFEVRTFASSQEFLDTFDDTTPGCIVLDVSMPGVNGLELQQALADKRCQRPIVFLTGHGDIPMSVEAMKSGAVDFLTKPVDGDRLVSAIRTALDKDRQARHARSELDAIEHRLASLTPREREVMELVVCGRLNKQIAVELGTVEKTIKVHRGRVMDKMEAASLADLVRIAGRAGIQPREHSSAR